MTRARHEGPTGSVTWRSVLLALLLIPPNAVWVVHSEVVWGITYLTIVALFFNVLTTLFALVLLNHLARHWGVKALSRGELLTVFSLVSIGCTVAGNNMLANLIYHLAFLPHHATAENEWGALFSGHFPEWLTVRDGEVARAFYEGDSSILLPANLKAWAGPLAWWFAFILVFVGVLVCLNLLMRRQWTTIERLTYPIIQAPYALTEPGGETLRSRPFQIGFAVATVVHLVNGANYYVPSVPLLGLRIDDISPLFTMEPWRAIGWTPLTLYFWVVGIVYFIPLELSFSCWFFYAVAKGQRVLGAAVGLSRLRGYPWGYEQQAGGWVGLFAAAVWLARDHIRETLRPPGRDERDESPVAYRVAWWGMVVGVAALSAFLMVMGFRPWVAVAFVVIVIATNLTISKIRAELGHPQHEFFLMSAEPILMTTFGPLTLGHRTVALMPLLYWWNRTMGSHPSPHILEALKLANMTDAPRREQRRLIGAMYAAVAIGLVSAAGALLFAAYRWGVESRFLAYTAIPYESFGRAAGRLRHPQSPDVLPILGMAGGAVASSLMMALRSRFLWWPLHPVGYVLSTSGWIINYLWFSFFVAWAVKLCVMKSGGVRAYRRLAPLFIGFLVGEIVVGSLWALVGVVLGRESYGFYED